ncbi:MAG: helix-turn-helix transcriptional regulator [Clostridia bacterium]|nr:helix-turn-helix transcriptional regulator [Clostridia bacterium]
MHNSQEVANAIKDLLKSKNITAGKMLSDCNLSVNTLSSMQSGGYYPRLEAIAKIADYLDCSVDYLLGRTDVVEVNRRAFVYTGYGEVAALGGIENPQPPKKRRETT